LYLRLLLCRRLLVGEGARRVGLALEPAAREHDALGDGLLGRGQQALVEPDRVRARHLVERPGHLARVEAAAQHLRGEQPLAARAGSAAASIFAASVTTAGSHATSLGLSAEPFTAESTCESRLPSR